MVGFWHKSVRPGEMEEFQKSKDCHICTVSMEAGWLEASSHLGLVVQVGLDGFIPSR